MDVPLTNLYDNFFDNFFDDFFGELFDDIFDNFLVIFLMSFLTIASLRIGVCIFDFVSTFFSRNHP